MAKTYARLVSQIKKLEQRAAKLMKGRTVAIARANRLIAKFEIAAGDLMIGAGQRVKLRAEAATKRAKGRRKKRGKVAPKYRGPGGLTWSGRGLTPVWLREAIKKGKRKEDFLIKKAG